MFDCGLLGDSVPKKIFGVAIDTVSLKKKRILRVGVG